MTVPLPAAAKQLPRDLWVIERSGPDRIAVAMHEHGGALWWTWFALADLPNDLIKLADYEALLVQPVDLRSALEAEYV